MQFVVTGDGQYPGFVDLIAKGVGVLLCMAGCMLMMPAAHAEAAWRLAVEKEGVQVWKRKEAGSDIDAFRAETTVTSSLSGLLALFYDLDAAPQWLDHTHRVVALERNDAEQKYVLLMETTLPWPLKNRDAVIVGQWSQDVQTKVVYLRGKSAPRGAHPENPAYLRYHELRSDWTFIPLGRGKVRVIMEGHADPAGNLPAWAVNLLIQESPLQTVKNLRAIISRSKYQQSRFRNIDE